MQSSSTEKITKPIAFVAAGSGGHIQSALAVLEYVQQADPEMFKRCVFVGSNLNMEGELKKKSLEQILCERMGVPFYMVRGGKLQRQLSFRSIKLFFGILYGFLDAFRFFRLHKPEVVIAFGGYSSLPMGIMARLFKKKLIIHEQTTSIGLTNNILQRFANVSAISYANSKLYFNKAKNLIMTGSPSREYIFNVRTYKELEKYLQKNNLPLREDKHYMQYLSRLEHVKGKEPILLIVGGSQGSHMINETVSKCLKELAEEYYVYIQTGDNQVLNDFEMLNKVRDDLPVKLQQKIIIRKFIFEEMGLLYRLADIFLGRSGANTVYEMGMMNISSIFVPIPWVTKNEQFTNAKILKDLGVADIINQENFTPQSLLFAVHNTSRLKKLNEEDRQKLFPMNAAENIYKIMKKHS